MRQANPSTNLVLAILAGLGLLGSLSLSWYAAPVTDSVDTDGPVERGAFQVSQVFAAHAKGVISGNDALGSGRMALVALVAVVALVAFAVGTPALRRPAEDLLRVVAIAAPIVVIVAAAAHPGTNTPVRLHYGMLIGFAAALLMASAAWHGATMREKRKPPVRTRYGTR